MSTISTRPNRLQLAELCDGGGRGVGLNFSADGREHCRGDFGPDGGACLVVNRYCSPHDFSSGVVPDLYFAAAENTRITGAFAVGSTGLP